MFKNYYLFQQQIQDIRPLICNSVINSVYTVHKNELIFDLQKDDDFFQLVISINPARPFILLSKQINYKGARYNKFEMINGLKIKTIHIITNNKFVKIELDSHYLSAFFYSNFPNIIVYDAMDQFLDSFKSIKNAQVIEKPNENLIQRNEAQIKEHVLLSAGLSVKELIKQVFPAFNNQMLGELFNRLNCSADDSIENLDKQKFSDTLIKFNKEITSGNAYIYRRNAFTHYLLLYQSTLLRSDPQYQFEQFSSVNKAWNIFSRENQKQNDFEKLINPILKAIKKRKHVLETTLSKLAEAEDIESRKQMADLKGNLIIANKHKIPRGSVSVELINIFSEQQEKIVIKLNPKKTSVENATYYFQKYKNMAEKKQVIALKKSTYLKELDEISELENKTQQATLKDLAGIKEQLQEMNVMQAPAIKEKTKQSLKYAFKRLILDNAWDIYIGKNNLNNDQLTFEFANKWDVWLHAQGVSGSHVIIKLPGKNTTTPRHIIEQAAQIAASNSKAKHSSTVAVIYTEVRYVSKIRGAPPGTVNVKNEKVVFVKPLNLNQ